MTPADRDRLAILVHEVRSPVAALVAIAETYGDAGLDRAEKRSLVQLAVAGCRGIERLVTDAALASVRREEVDLGRLVEEAVAAATLGGANVRADVASGIPRVQADPIRLRQALDNLVSNALVHGTGGKVIVSVRSKDGYVLVAVEDQGPGVPVDEHERIFETGVRLDTDRPGSGFGLALARALVEAHQGTLTLESTSGQGATFTIALPVS
jgi:two-component system, OmpR family, sensor kinase